MKKLVAILGAGESGVGAAILAQKKGYGVFVSDLGKIKEKYKNVLSNYKIDFEEEKHSETKILNAGLVVKSPGIPETAPLIIKLKEKGIPVISKTSIARISRFLSFCSIRLAMASSTFASSIRIASTPWLSA